MKRKEFLRLSALAGIGLPFLSTSLSGCSATEPFFEDFPVNFDGKVVIIGAGAAGITAGYILNRYNIDFEILEASSVVGGRVKEINNFADFPIDLGAEWVHTDPSILARLRNDPDTAGNIEMIKYNPETLDIWRNGKIKSRNFFVGIYSEYKFKSTTWYNYFDTYFLPSIQDRIRLETPVNAIDYSGSQIQISTTTNETITADRVILTVPLTILKQNYIQFSPDFPAEKTDALDLVTMPDGIKVFIEFSERFYPDMIAFNSVFDLLDSSNGELLYYDAAFGKDVQKHVLGLFTVGDPAVPYATSPTEEELLDYMLKELDDMYNGKASQTYVQHVVQNWSKEPFIQGSYSHWQDYAGQEVLKAPIENKIFFAGEAYAESDSTVHGAAESAYEVVQAILQAS